MMKKMKMIEDFIKVLAKINYEKIFSILFLFLNNS